MSTTATYHVVGMTCQHCVHSVTEELTALSGVSSVAVDLVSGGVSAVHVTSDGPLSDLEVSAALDEAGEYRLAPGQS